MLRGSAQGKPAALEAAKRRCVALVLETVTFGDSIPPPPNTSSSRSESSGPPSLSSTPPSPPLPPSPPSPPGRVLLPLVQWHLAAVAKRTSLHDVRGVFCLWDWVEALVDAMSLHRLVFVPSRAGAGATGPGPAASAIDLDFVVSVVRRVLVGTDHTLALMRTLAFVYAHFSLFVAGSISTRYHLLEHTLLEPHIFTKLFLHWSPAIRTYFTHLLVWRLGYLTDIPAALHPHPYPKSQLHLHPHPRPQLQAQAQAREQAQASLECDAPAHARTSTCTNPTPCPCPCPCPATCTQRTLLVLHARLAAIRSRYSELDTLPLALCEHNQDQDSVRTSADCSSGSGTLVADAASDDDPARGPGPGAPATAHAGIASSGRTRPRQAAPARTLNTFASAFRMVQAALPATAPPAPLSKPGAETHETRPEAPLQPACTGGAPPHDGVPATAIRAEKRTSRRSSWLGFKTKTKRGATVRADTVGRSSHVLSPAPSPRPSPAAADAPGDAPSNQAVPVSRALIPIKPTRAFMLRPTLVSGPAGVLVRSLVEGCSACACLPGLAAGHELRFDSSLKPYAARTLSEYEKVVKVRVFRACNGTWSPET